MPVDRSDREVVRVTRTDGAVINVRKDGLERYLADNPGAVAEGEKAEEKAEEETTGRRRAR